MSMHGKTLIILLCALLLSIGISAQPKLPKTQQAIAYTESGQLIQARDQILIALKDQQEQNHPYTWFVKGYIYKEIYKLIDKQSRYSDNREIAVDAILRSMELDLDHSYLDNNLKGITYLAQSYFNDAVSLTRSLNYENQDEPERYYARYKQLYKLVDAGYDFSPHEIDLYSNLASGFRKLYEADREQNKPYIDRAISCYEKVLSVEPDNYTANYNLAICYYNQGAWRISKINYQTEIFELVMIQDECIKLFKLSVPYMLEAHRQNPERLETLQGLRAIYWALNEDEKSESYYQEMQRLIKEGKIKN